MEDVESWVGRGGFQPCVFSYGGISTQFYRAIQTIETEVLILQERLKEYLDHYDSCENLVLIGYSLGGLVITELLSRYDRSEDAPPSALKGVLLVATPVSLKSSNLIDSSGRQIYNEGRALMYGRLAESSLVNDHLGFLNRVTLVRCATDELLDDSVYIPTQEIQQRLRRYAPPVDRKHENITREGSPLQHIIAEFLLDL